MDEQALLAERFEEERGRLRTVAYRMLGSAGEADDAVQEAWLRASAAGTGGVENLGAWLTTIVGRVCLNMLRSRDRRREDPLELRPAEPAAEGIGAGADPEEEAELADAVGVALLVVLDRLAPAERLAFVLHDMFAVPYDEIAPLLDKSPAAARQLASRARRRVQGGSPAPEQDRSRRRQVVEAYLAATRGGDFEALLGLLHPEVVLRADPAAGLSGKPVFLGGAQTVAKAAMASMERAWQTGPALVDGALGLVMARGGSAAVVLTFTLADGLIAEIDVVGEPDRLRELELAVPGGAA